MFIGLFCFNIIYIKIQLYLKKKKKDFKYKLDIKILECHLCATHKSGEKEIVQCA